MRTRWTLAQTLSRHGKTVPALVKANGVSRSTVYNIASGKVQAIRLETVGKLLAGLEAITGHPMPMADVLCRPVPSVEGAGADPALQAQLAGARPFHAEDLLALVPTWTEDECAENDRFWAEMEAEKQTRRDALRQGAAHVNPSV